MTVLILQRHVWARVASGAGDISCGVTIRYIRSGPSEEENFCL